MARRTGNITVRAAGSYGASAIIRELDSVSREYFFQAIDEIGKIGEEEMRRTIMGTDSQYSRSGLKAKMGFPILGRIRTGAMYQSAGSRPRGAGKLFQAEVGYIRGKYQEYFKFQEFGFYNIWKYFKAFPKAPGYAPANIPPGHVMRRRANPKEYRVPGIFALRNAREKMEDSIPAIMNRLDRRIDRRLNRLSKSGKI